MSSMLEQAIVDAEALREAALKNAEQVIIDKYSSQIKEAVEHLLEQPEEMQEQEEEAENQEESPAEDVTDQLTDASMDGKDLCPCPEEDEIVTLNFDDLKKEIEKEQSSFDMEKEPQQELAADVLSEPEELQENLEEEIEINEEELKDLLEKITLDLQVVPHGHLGRPTEAEMLDAVDITKAHEAIEEMNKEFEKENKKLKSELKESKEKVSSLQGKLSEYIETVLKLKEHLSQVNVSNAKLLYTNRVLGSTSLNERQKDKIVEALSKASSVKEAKVIFETLQGAVGSSEKREPKSLSEAVEKRSSLLMSYKRRQKEEVKEDPMKNRWKTLAGIN